MYHQLLRPSISKTPQTVRAAWLCAFFALVAVFDVTTLKSQTSSDPGVELTADDHQRLYHKTREVVRQWDAIAELPRGERGPIMGGLLRDLKLIDPTQLPPDARIMPLPEVLKLLAERWPDEYNRATIMTANLEGVLWVVHLRLPFTPPGRVLGDDTLMRLELDALSGTVLFPYIRD